MTLAQQEQQRWEARPALARLLRCVLFAIPLAVSTAVVLVLRPLVPGGMRWAVLLGVLAVVVAVVFERALRRFLPLATLLRLTMLFPDQAPSRYKVARSAGNPEELGRRLAKDPDAVSTAEQVLALITALGEHDRRTRGHSERVRVFCDLLAEQLHLEQGDRDRLRWAALLHDVGKLSIAPAVLNKPDRLDDREFTLVKDHPARGAALTAPLLPWLGEWGLGIVEHHERYDGAGYPAGLTGIDISRAGRIVGIVDAFETMTAARAYKKPMATKAAREELARCAGTQFDPTYVRAFLAISLPRLVWTMGPLSFVLQLPFLSSIAQAGSRSAAVSSQTATALAGAGAVAGAGMVGVLAPLPVEAPEPARAVIASAAGERDVDAPPPSAPSSPTSPSTEPAAAEPPAAPPAGQPAPLQAAGAGTTAPLVGSEAVPVGWPFAPSTSTAVTPDRGPAAAPPARPAAPPPVPPPPPASPSASPSPAPASTPTPSPSPSPSPSTSPTASPSPTTSPPPTTSPSPSRPPTEPVEVAPAVTLTQAPVGTVASPVTVAFTADRAGTAFSCSVDGGPWTACSSPVELALSDGEHVVAVRGTSPSGLTGPPARTAAFVVATPGPSVRLLDPPTGTVGSDSVSLRFESDTVGATFECAVDGGLWTSCTSPFTRTFDDGPHTVDVRAVSVLGGAGRTERASFTVDAPGPDVVLTSVPAPTGTEAAVEVAFSSDDRTATFECAVDGGPWSACTSPGRFQLPVGPHVVAVRAVSPTAGAGAAQSAEFSIVPPTARITSAPSGTVTSGDVQLSFTSDDPRASYDCRLDDGAWTTCTSPWTVAVPEGTHALSVRAVGAGTGPGPVASTGSFVVDVPGPNLVSDTDPPRNSSSSSVQWSFHSDDPEATFECRVNGEQWYACSSPATFELDEGNHVLKVRAISATTGIGESLTSGSVTVRLSGPEAEIDSAPSGTVAPSDVVLAFSSPDQTASFECRVDGGSWTTCASPASFALADGEHVLSVRALDRRGEAGAIATTPPFTVATPADSGQVEADALAAAPAPGGDLLPVQEGAPLPVAAAEPVGTEPVRTEPVRTDPAGTDAVPEPPAQAPPTLGTPAPSAPEPTVEPGASTPVPEPAEAPAPSPAPSPADELGREPDAREPEAAALDHVPDDDDEPQD